MLRESRTSRWPVGAIVLGFCFSWVVLRSADSYPRMWIWLLPGVSYAVALAISKFRLAAIPVIVSVGAMLVASLPSWDGDDLQNIEVARIATVVEDAGLAVCPVGNSMEPLLAYRQTKEPILGAGQFDRCDLVYSLDELGDWAIDAFELAAGGVVLRTDSGTSGIPRDNKILQAIARENRISTETMGQLPCAGLFGEVESPGIDVLTIHQVAAERSQTG